MDRYMFVVMTNAVEGQDEAFNAWYDSQHVGDVLKVPGFRSAQRFVLPPDQAGPNVKHRYLALYEVETDDVKATQAALGAAVSSGAMPLSDTLDMGGVFNVFYKAMGEKVTAG
jgi:hypothetical protein